MASSENTRKGLVYAGIGSRRTPDEVLARMRDIAEALREGGWTLRSGAALGADQWFERGAGTAKEIWRPEDARNEAYWHAERFHPAWNKCGPRARALHARNSHILLGEYLRTPVKFVVCWTPRGEVVGGTGQALRIAASPYYSIPVFNLGAPGRIEDHVQLVLEFAKGVARESV